jgi:hypothetical protein
MKTWEEWVEENHPELNELKVFGHDIDLRKTGQAAALGASLLAGSMLPPHKLASGDQPLPFAQALNTQTSGHRPFNPDFGPKPAYKKMKELKPSEVWRYQFRWVQEQEALMRRGRRPSPEYVEFVRYYNNHFPDPPM